MPSVTQDRRGYWTAKYRGIRAERETKHRIPKSAYATIPAEQQKAAMQGFAERCDELCRTLEHYPAERIIGEALRNGAITEEQARSLRAGLHINAGGEITMRSAFLEHRTTGEEEKKRPKAFADGMRDIERWEAYAKACGLPKLLQDVTATHVAGYVKHLAGLGYAWDTRRMALIPLKRAAKQGKSYGIPDVLSGEKLNPRDDGYDPTASRDAWTLPELATSIAAVEADPGSDRRIAALLVLGGMLGLCPTEIQRARVSDLDGDVLRIGLRKHKTRSRRRNLPVPPAALEVLHWALEGRDDDDAMVCSLQRGRVGNHMSDTGFTQWGRRQLKSTTGRDLPPKWLRKTFATWSIMHRIEKEVYERYLGHKIPGIVQVTGEHYLLDQIEAELRTIGLPAMQPILEAALETARKGEGTHKGTQARKYVLRLVQ